MLSSKYIPVYQTRSHHTCLRPLYNITAQAKLFTFILTCFVPNLIFDNFIRFREKAKQIIWTDGKEKCRRGDLEEIHKQMIRSDVFTLVST
jgi:hypothetical protein